jgi:predicted nuclease of predicted toxin-antitoxin system
MNFIVDAQLPRHLVILLRRLEHEAQHTWGFDSGNRTPDEVIAKITDRKGAVVVTKDADFVNSHMLESTPQKLLLITTGNISNRTLLRLFENNIDAIVCAPEESNFLELNHSGLVIH